jgi:hypothetical protein
MERVLAAVRRRFPRVSASPFSARWLLSVALPPGREIKKQFLNLFEASRIPFLTPVS